MTPPHRATMVIATMSLLVVVGCRAESQADTLKFPDFSDYTAVNVGDYEVDTSTPGRPSKGVYFLTPTASSVASPVIRLARDARVTTSPVSRH